MSRYARHIWAVNPDLLYFLPPEKSSFLPYTVAFEGTDPPPHVARRKLTIAHAPTNRSGKGSEIILPALERLSRRYPDTVEVRLIEGATHKQALAAYRDVDLAIDQVLIGCSVFGENACEIIHIAAAVIGFGGTIDYFIQGVFNYPTLSDTFKYAAYDGLQRMARRASRTMGLPSAVRDDA